MEQQRTQTSKEINGVKLYLDGYLEARLKTMWEYQRKNFDVPIIVDGPEGSGKSTLAMAIAWYLTNGKFSPEQIIEGEDDIVEKLDKAEEGSVLLIDEGFLMFSSRDSMSRKQKALVQILSVIRQKRIILIIVAPSFFELNKYIAIHRTRCLIHVFTKGYERGRFVYFNEQAKKILYLEGKKKHNSYSCVKSTFFGRFTNFEPPFLKDYLETKKKSLMEALRKGYDSSKAPTEKQIKVKLAQQLKANNPKITVPEIAKAFAVSERTIFNWFKEDIDTQEGDMDQ